MYKYHERIYATWKELREATKLSGCKTKAKLKDGEITIINDNHTGLETYEELYNNTEHSSL